MLKNVTGDHTCAVTEDRITKQKEQENGQSTMMNHQVLHNVDQARRNVSI